MRIRDAYESGRPVFSFEFFPPKTDQGAENLMHTVGDLQEAVKPDFVSVTYGAGGQGRDRTHAILTRIQSELGTPAMAHQTCVADRPEDVARNVERLIESGVENILALRGDLPQEEGFRPPDGAFAHATELIEFLVSRFDLSIGAACYPEVHPESKDAREDLRWTRAKQDCGAAFLITQLFFDNTRYFEFLESARAAGIVVPIVPGIMPITNVAQVERFTKMCGATIPASLRDRLQRLRDDPASVMAAGIEHAITQCLELLDAGAPGIHFYTLNKSHATRGILAALRRHHR